VTNNVLITFSKVNSTHLEYEQLKCVLCYLIVACVGFKRGIIHYMATNGIPTFQKHLKISHQGIQIEWEKVVGWKQKINKKKV
jgi:hypothetical protein